MLVPPSGSVAAGVLGSCVGSWVGSWVGSSVGLAAGASGVADGAVGALTVVASTGATYHPGRELASGTTAASAISATIASNVATRTGRSDFCIGTETISDALWLRRNAVGVSGPSDDSASGRRATASTPRRHEV